MLKKGIFTSLVVILSFIAFGQKKAYKIYKSDGSPAQYQEMLKGATKNDVTFFGELHNNPVCHWLQLELAKDMLADKSKDLIMGAEMFEQDNQVMINEYLAGEIAHRSFKKQARLWNNYKTDYKPLLDLAKNFSLPFIATNIPRRYASMVSNGGFQALDSLQDQAYNWIAPLPVPYDPELPGYKAMNKMMRMHGKSNPNLPKAQAIKDATMGHFIVENLENGSNFLHFNGNYHSKNHEGIVWYLKKYSPQTSVFTIATAEQDKIDKLQEENKAMADFIIVVPSSMTKTY